MNNTGKIDKVWQIVEWIEKCYYASDILGPILNLFVFFVILFYIERKWLLMRNVAAILPLKSKLYGKFQRFNAINRSTKMLKTVEFSKISIRIKNCKTFCKAQTAKRLKKFIQLRRYIEIYRHLLSKCFKNAVFGRHVMV